MKQTATIAQVEQVPKLNREQRRAAKHNKPKQAPRKGNPLAMHQLINMVQTFEPGELIAQHNETRIALELLRTGHGTEAAFDRVSMTLNIGLVLAEGIDAILVDIMVRAQAGMVRMQDRYRRGLSFGFDAAGLLDVPEAISTYEEIADMQSAMQISQAVKTAYYRWSGGKVLTPEWANAARDMKGA